MNKQTEMQALLASAKGEKPLADSLPLWQAAEVQKRRRDSQPARSAGGDAPTLRPAYQVGTAYSLTTADLLDKLTEAQSLAAWRSPASVKWVALFRHDAPGGRVQIGFLAADGQENRYCVTAYHEEQSRTAEIPARQVGKAVAIYRYAAHLLENAGADYAMNYIGKFDPPTTDKNTPNP